MFEIVLIFTYRYNYRWINLIANVFNDLSEASIFVIWLHIQKDVVQYCLDEEDFYSIDADAIGSHCVYH